MEERVTLLGDSVMVTSAKIRIKINITKNF